MKLEITLFCALFGVFTLYAQEQYTIIVDGKEVVVNTTNNNIVTAVATPNTDNSNINRHTVKAGENLFSISRLYNITVAELCKLNNLDREQILSIGKELRIVNFTKSYNNISNASYHIVVKGDTLYSLARRYGTTVDALKLKNNLDSNIILISQRLKLN